MISALLSCLVLAGTNPPGQPKSHRLFSANPLCGLPVLPKVRGERG
jgi:hypothetical protein